MPSPHTHWRTAKPHTPRTPPKIEIAGWKTPIAACWGCWGWKVLQPPLSSLHDRPSSRAVPHRPAPYRAVPHRPPPCLSLPHPHSPSRILTLPPYTLPRRPPPSCTVLRSPAPSRAVPHRPARMREVAAPHDHSLYLKGGGLNLFGRGTSARPVSSRLGIQCRAPRRLGRGTERQGVPGLPAIPQAEGKTINKPDSWFSFETTT